VSEPTGGGPRSPLDFPDFSKLRDIRFPRRRPSGGSGGDGGFSGRRVGLVALVLLALVLLLDAFFTIQPEEVGIILRLGRYRGPEHDAGPGLHAKLPVVDRLIKVPVQRQLKQEFGFRTAAVSVRSSFAEVGDEAAMLTGDENVVIVEWVVQYRIVDAYRYLFKVRNIEQTFRDLSEAVMRAVVGDRTVDEVVTVGRVDIEIAAQEELQALCEQYETGIRVEKVLLQSNNPPDPVKPSFNDVNQAEQDRNKLINEAQAQYNRVVPRAEGEALQTIQQAEGYALDRVNRARGDAARFEALFAEYRKAPEVTRKRIYLETMGKILPQVGKKVVVDRSVEGLVPMFDFSGRAAAGAAATQAPPGGAP
jgi:modulator of FtsH protease HflK